MYEGCDIFKFGIPNKDGGVTEKVGEVLGMICKTRKDLQDWIREGGYYQSDALDVPIAIMCKIDIHPDRRGKRLSHAAIERFKMESQKKGRSQVLLNADPTQGSPFIVTLYEKHGFKLLGPSMVGHFMLYTTSASQEESVSGS